MRWRSRRQRCFPCRHEKEQQQQQQQEQQQRRLLLEASASLSPKKKEASSRRATRAPGGRSWAGPCDEWTSLMMSVLTGVFERERVSFRFGFRLSMPSIA